MIWAAGTNMDDVGNSDSSAELRTILKMSFFDKTMFLFNTYFTECVYSMLMIGAPLDICRSFMLKENKRLYAMIICSIASFKCII